MRGGSAQWAQHVGPERLAERQAAPNNRRRPASDRREVLERRGARKPKGTGVYRRRRIGAVSVVLLGVLVLISAAFAQNSGMKERALPIDPDNAAPDVVLAEAAGVYISSPIRPEDLTGLGYHPESESFIEMSPRGKNLSANPVLGIFARGSTPEKIQYYLMDPGTRQGPRTGALDVGAKAGAPVYAPVTGTVTAVRPDPVLRDANVVEIKPADNNPYVRVNPTDNSDVRVLVSLVQDIDSGIAPKSSVTAGMTKLGSVADSAKALKPQLASYTSDTGNHVTVAVLKTN